MFANILCIIEFSSSTLCLSFQYLPSVSRDRLAFLMHPGTLMFVL